MVVFQVATQEGWSDLMQTYSDSFPRVLTSIFFISCIISCAVFLLNLTVAFLLQSYSQLDKEAGFMAQNEAQLK